MQMKNAEEAITNAFVDDDKYNKTHIPEVYGEASC